MNLSKTMEATAQEFIRKSLELRKQVLRLVTTLPDSANGVTLLSKSCASVSLSTVQANHGILSPQFYITRHAKTELIRMIKRTPDLLALDRRIKNVIQTGKLDAAYTEYEKVPPEFRRALKGIWCGADAVCPWLSKLTEGIRLPKVTNVNG